MKKIIVILAFTLILILVLFSISCSIMPSNTPAPSSTQIVTPTPTPSQADAESTQVKNMNIAEDFIRSSSTFKFDGIEGSLILVKAEPGPSSSFRSTSFIFEFQDEHPGYGDRTGQVLAQVITKHTAMILVNIEKGVVAYAVCDNTWNMVTEKDLPVTVSGIVVSGGDTTPADGPKDAPRAFTYKIQKNDGTFVNVSYTAYPPSPVGDAARAMVLLDFYAGMVNVGDKMEAYGTLDKKTDTVMVANHGDYIRTSVPKMEVIGQVISVGGEPLQPGLPAADTRKFIYIIQKDDGVYVNITYTLRLSSSSLPAKIALSYYDGEPKVGDYMMVYGTYDISTNTITVADQGDLIKTYPLKP